MTAPTAGAAELFINGQFRPASATVPVVEAATGEVLAEGPAADAADIDAAVEAAHGTPALEWRKAPAAERAEVLKRFAAALRARSADTAVLVSRENGMPISLSRAVNGAFPAALVNFYAKLITAEPIEEVRSALVGHTIVRKEPVGVVGAITPWNYPQALAIMKIAPALAAGCSVVLKAAPETSLDARVFAEAAVDSGLPAGVLAVVPGDAEAGAYLVGHPGIDKVAFTGSTNAGRAIAAECGRLIRPVTLELGGKSAAIVLDDADLKSTIAGLRTVSFVNNGQTCHLSSRILVPQSRYAEFVEAIAELARSLKIGDPLDDSTEIGPLVSARQRERVLDYVRIGREEGAKLVAGGGVPDGFHRGWYVQPTVFADVDNRSRIAQEEIFGPVLTITVYRDDEEAVRIANDTEFGLAGTVWSTNPDRATEIARAVHTGTVGVNHYQLDMAAPFGGVKASGMGRELGPEGLEAYRYTKSIYRTESAE
ncbi:aldehyde dehydrogenase family protein [Mycolicibacterium hassiacum DSM 44199]|uniref:Aldehyde dehydrogenase family protein n=1 Tax=Mycolicibacterium hassiacum (strain DSM 44199 / CIP 105218 / JCM 12690 / 3849) TaxID=1122247 RepID=K5BKA6_MYCHD|nr:aldehyde dehydrogenase [Mycolicibacterium hassiacum]EKF24529.1 aldehyde dehydrogenase family protein [Mycolicibacterium hassiacum DSM 44199]MBX5488272.1 aldehyde dehydrogenase [Mycolicibacterium hassiacum]MDA4084349.1 aldehyde dehydrogenase [Mycolicibacterium hassiacum DSM 44199]PZN22138.1 MAG: aldehyde dehydrogenase [Mycolicibacterium hassiacum]VCT88971.1 Geranial dehydrogenase [Mycolicibacterium hassiacum DSM 44199]